MAYDYNLGNNNQQTYNQANATVGQGGAYQRFNYGPQQGSGLDLQALQNANRGGYGGHNIGQQAAGGNYAGAFNQMYGAYNQQPQFSIGGAPGQQVGQGGIAYRPASGMDPVGAPVQGDTSYMLPGETGGQWRQRIQSQYDRAGQRPLAREQDWQVHAAGGVPGGTGSGFGGTGFGQDPDEAKLERHREIALQRIADQRDFYSSPIAQELMGSMAGAMRGENSPYPALTTAQLGENADAAGASFAREQAMARRMGANSGQTGGGRVHNALMSSGRAAGAMAGQGRRKIQSTNALLEDQRRERARQEATAYLGQQAQNAWNATQAENEMRGRFQIVGERPDQLGTGLGGGLGFDKDGNAQSWFKSGAQERAPSTGGTLLGRETARDQSGWTSDGRSRDGYVLNEKVNRISNNGGGVW